MLTSTAGSVGWVGASGSVLHDAGVSEVGAPGGSVGRWARAVDGAPGHLTCQLRCGRIGTGPPPPRPQPFEASTASSRGPPAAPDLRRPLLKRRGRVDAA